MPPRNKQGVNFFIDMEALGETIGAIEEAAQVANSDRFIGKLINEAHKKVSKEFDEYIVARAATTNSLSHMFEWGTVGVNPGRTTRRMNPNSPESHLWQHVLTGSGKSKSAGFVFKPSKVPVPQPTTTGTGISQKFLAKLKGKHIFWNKAAVMESGQTVTITPKQGGKLFIPLNGFQSEDLRSNDIKRGFIMTPHSVDVTPTGHVGVFNAFWEKFWNGAGDKSMSRYMQESLDEHLERVAQKTQARKGAPKPATPAAMNAAVKRGKAVGKAEMEK